MTTKPTEAHDATPATEPLALRLSEGLGPLPKPDVFDPGRFGVAWREEKVRSYAAQAVTAERKRFAAAVNDALPFCCQFAVDALTPFSGQAKDWYRASGDDAELANLPPLI